MLQTIRFFAAVCIVLSVLSIAFAGAPEKWTAVRSRNFELAGNADPAVIADVALRLERFREIFRTALSHLTAVPARPVKVVVFRDQTSYRPFKPLRPDGTPDDIVAGFFQAGEDADYITTSAPDAGTLATLFHEYVHHQIDVNFRSAGLPPWLNEGIAEYYETLDAFPAGTVSIGRPPSGHIQLLRSSRLIPASEFFAMDSRSLHSAGDETRALFYAQAWAAVHFLLNGEGSDNAAFAALTEKGGRDDALRKAFGRDRAGFEPAIRSYLANPVAARSMDLQIRNTAANEPIRHQLPESRVDAILGDLLFQSGRFAEAEQFLKRSLAADPSAAAARSSLGKTLARSKRYGEAKPHLEKAIAANAADGLAHFYYAYAISRDSVDADGTVSEFPAVSARLMLDSLSKAIRFRPEFPDSYRLVAFIHLVNSGDLAEAETAAQNALALRPGQHDYSLLLAQVLLRREKYDAAKDLAVKLSVVAGPKVRNEAFAIIDAANEYYRSIREGDIATEIFIGALPPLILKRSTLTDEDVAAIDRDRVVTNLNRLLGRPLDTETRIVGRVELITCSDEKIVYKITSEGESFFLSGVDFAELRMSVLTEGERAFEIGCGTKLSNHLTVLTFVPSPGTKASERGRLSAITFVPDFFRLKTPAEMARARTVIIEDDRTARQKPGG